MIVVYVHEVLFNCYNSTLLVLSDPVEKKMKERKRRKIRLLYLHPKLSSGLIPLAIGIFTE